MKNKIGVIMALTIGISTIPHHSPSDPRMSITNKGHRLCFSIWGGPSEETELYRGKQIIATLPRGSTYYEYWERNYGVTLFTAVRGNKKVGIIYSVGKLTWDAPSAGPDPDGYRVYLEDKNTGLRLVFDVGPARELPIVATGIYTGEWSASVASYIGDKESEKCEPIVFFWHNVLLR